MTVYYDDGTIRVRSMVPEDAKTIFDTYQSYGWHPVMENYENYYKEQEAGERLVFIPEYEGKQLGQYEPCVNDDDLLLFFAKKLR